MRWVWWLSFGALAVLLIGVVIWSQRDGASRQLGGERDRTEPGRQANSDVPPLAIKHLGIELGAYDAATGMAGELTFHKDNLEFSRIFLPFGWQIPANDVGPAKGNPQPTFIAPIGTPVRSIVDGVVVAIPTLYSGDVSIQ